MPIPTERDEAATTTALAHWLGRVIEGAREITVTDLAVPDGSGFSNETMLCTASWTSAEGSPVREELVVRVEPTGYQVFLESDFELQYQLLEVLDQDTDVPVPPILWFEDDENVLGAPFFVMRRVPGRAAPDAPPYNQEGWLHDTPAEVRRRLWEGAVDALIAVHRVPTDKVAFIAKPELGATGLDQIFEYWRRSFEWAARGEEYRIAASALDWLESNMPVERPTALSWGDARIGNILFHDGEVQAVLDWEMLSLGGHEMDLGWWLFLDSFHSFDVPRLDGLGTRDETIERWEAGTGERACDLAWYEAFSGFRFAIVLMRIGQMYESFGVSREDRGDMERNNPVLHLLARQLDLEPPTPFETP